MAKAGGRKYNRDKNGRFAPTGGGGKSGGGGKAQATRQKNVATDQRLIGKGLRAVGNRLKGKTAGLYAGTKATQRNNAQLWADGGKQIRAPKRKAGTTGAGTRSMLKANAAQVGKIRNRAASKAGQKPKTGAQAAFASKAAPSAAKQQYQALRSQQRRNQRYDWAANKSDSAKAAGVTRKLNTMVKNRGVSKPKRKGKK